MTYSRFEVEEKINLALSALDELDNHTALGEAMELRLWMRDQAHGILVRQIQRAYDDGLGVRDICTTTGYSESSIGNLLSNWRKRTGDTWYHARYLARPSLARRLDEASRQESSTE